MTREKIENFREVILPFNRRVLLKIDYEGQGASDAEEFAKDFNEILNLAIKALEQEPTADNDSAVDCISRKAVLDAIDSKAWEFCDYLISKGRNDEQKPVSHFADNLRECVREELPSVTPQEPQSFEWCTDCKEYDQEKHCCHRYSKVIRDAVAKIEQEPKMGHWIEKEDWDGDVYYECSVCGEPFCLIDGTPTDNMYHFCPNCGADMREVEK